MEWLPVISIALTALIALVGWLFSVKIARIEAAAEIEAAKQAALAPPGAPTSSGERVTREWLEATRGRTEEIEEERRECQQRLLEATQAQYRATIAAENATRERDLWRDMAERRETEIVAVQYRYDQALLAIEAGLTEARQDLAQARATIAELRERER